MSASSRTRPTLPRQEITVLRPSLPSAQELLPYLRKIDQSRIYSNFGPLSCEFQQRLETLLQVTSGSVTCCSSGTIAIIAAILARTRGERNRKLAFVADFTFPASAIAVERCGFEPYFVDVDARDWSLEPTKLLRHPRLAEVGLVVPVAPFGRPIPQSSWRKFEEETGIPVVIDAAASFACVLTQPSEYLGKIPVALSFHATKSFGIGEGGCVVWTEADASDRLMAAINFGFFGDRKSLVQSINGKMSEYHAAVGLAELESWSKKSKKFQSRIALYQSYLSKSDLDGQLICYPSVDLSYPLLFCHNPSEFARLAHAFTEAKIGFRSWYENGLHSNPVYAEVARDPVPATEWLCRRLVGLPMSSDLSEESISFICSTISGALLSSVPSQQDRASQPSLVLERKAAEADGERGKVGAKTRHDLVKEFSSRE